MYLYTAEHHLLPGLRKAATCVKFHSLPGSQMGLPQLGWAPEETFSTMESMLDTI